MLICSFHNMFQSCFSLLTELTLVLSGCLSDYITSIIPGINYSLTDKNSSSTMKIDTLAFLNTVIANHEPTVFHPHLNVSGGYRVRVSDTPVIIIARRFSIHILLTDSAKPVN